MSGFGNAAWFWWGGAMAMALAGLLLLFWALGWDWFRTRKMRPRRCPKCWYDLSGTQSSMKCSECGYEAKRERTLHKSRRRWRWVFAGLVLILASGYPAVQPKVQRDGWWSLVSNRMLIAGLPFARDADDFWCREMARRVQYAVNLGDNQLGRSRAAPMMPMTREDWRMFFERCLEGDARARPISEDWQEKYGAILERWTGAGFNRPSKDGLAEQHVLYDLPTTVSVRTRDKWPEDVPLYFESNVQSWWPYGTSLHARVKPEFHDGDPFVLYRSSKGVVGPSRDIGEATFEFDATLAYNKSTEQIEATTIEPIEPVAVTVDIVPTLAECIDAAPSTALTSAMNMSFQAAVEPMGPPDRVYLTLDVRGLISPQFNGIAVGAWAEMLKNGEVQLSHPVWWATGEAQRIAKMNLLGLNQIGNRSPVDYKLPGQLVADASPGDVWEFRLRSDPEIALRVLDCDKYWDGEVTIPLTLPAVAAAGNGDDVDGEADK